jgi:hypothetical protein
MIGLKNLKNIPDWKSQNISWRRQPAAVIICRCNQTGIVLFLTGA